MVQSKIKQLEHMEIISAPERYDTKTFKSNFQPSLQSSRQVLNVSHLKIGYEKPLAEVSFNLERGQKLGIIGKNGIGKSTLLKTLMGKVASLSGEYKFGYNTEVAYFDQQLAQVSGDETIFDIFAGEFPRLNDTEIRRALGSFQFTGEEVFRSASTLSGGEKVRLALCKILYKRPNVLILDEPTNHMDIIGKETLEEILTGYEGTIVFVSHDRYFVNKIADRLLVFSDDGAEYMDCNYELYEEKRRERESLLDTEAEDKNKASTKIEKVRNFSPKKEIDKKKKRLDKLENLIAEGESLIEELTLKTESEEVCSDYQRLTEIQAEIDALKEKQSEYETEWALLFEELEAL
jgi:ATP-binding cassette subfamily F protein 3